MKIALCVSSLPLSGVGTSIGIILSGLSNAGHEVDVVITSWDPGSDFERAKRDGWSIKCCCEGVRFLKERLRRTLECLSCYDVIINNHSVAQLVAPCLPSDIIRISVMRGINDSPIRIAYVGWLRNRDKNVLLLPEIVACLYKHNIDFFLTIAGDGPDRRVLEEKMDRVEGKSRVAMLGEVPRGEARDILRKSHFTLIPSFYEGLSNVMLETMALGSVPIASNIANFQWVLGDAAAKLQVPISSADAYAKWIVELAADTKEYYKIQGYLRERQRTMFTPEKTINGYLALITKLKTHHRAKNFASVPFDKLILPGRYKRQCAVWWRCLQIARDCLRV